jgi:4-alpha-glucanotransferase
MSTLRGWWEEDYLQTQRYYNTMLGHYGTAPTVATPELCEEVVRNHLKSNSILCILSLQDWLSIDGKWRNPNVQEERINVPAAQLLALPDAPHSGTVDESRRAQ